MGEDKRDHVLKIAKKTYSHLAHAAKSLKSAVKQKDVTMKVSKPKASGTGFTKKLLKSMADVVKTAVKHEKAKQVDSLAERLEEKNHPLSATKEKAAARKKAKKEEKKA